MEAAGIGDDTTSSPTTTTTSPLRRGSGGRCGCTATTPWPCSTAASRRGAARAGRSTTDVDRSRSRRRSRPASGHELYASKADVLDVVDGRADRRCSSTLGWTRPTPRPVATSPARRPAHRASASSPMASTGWTRPRRGAASRRPRSHPADDRPVIAYCGGGVAATGTALAYRLAGFGDVAVYDGSWTEWEADPATPEGAATDRADARTAQPAGGRDRWRGRIGAAVIDRLRADGRSRCRGRRPRAATASSPAM